MSDITTATTPTPTELFISAFRQYPGSVSIITAMGPDGPVGMTVTSVISLSADPPLLGFSLSSRSSATPHLRAANSMVVHFLAPSDVELGRTFSTSGIDRFAPPTKWRQLSGGEPLLAGVSAWLRVVPQDSVQTAGCDFLICEVVAGEQDTSPSREPLLYHNRAFRQLGEECAAA